MWRAMALAIGITTAILGAECLLIDKAVLASKTTAAADGALSGGASAARREVKPPEWAPWTLLSAGAVIMLYSFTIPRRVAS